MKLAVFFPVPEEAFDAAALVGARALSREAGGVTFASAFTPAALTAADVVDVAGSNAAESTRARDFSVQAARRVDASVAATIVHNREGMVMRR